MNEPLVPILVNWMFTVRNQRVESERREMHELRVAEHAESESGAPSQPRSIWLALIDGAWLALGQALPELFAPGCRGPAERPEYEAEIEQHGRNLPTRAGRGSARFMPWMKFCTTTTKTTSVRI